MSTVDDDIVRVAERRQNLITTGELERLGLSTRSIQRRTARGQRRRVAPNVFTTATVPDDVSRRELALCLFHPAAVISHSSSIIEDVRNRGLCTDDELGEVYADLCGKVRRGSASWARLAPLRIA